MHHYEWTQYRRADSRHVWTLVPVGDAPASVRRIARVEPVGQRHRVMLACGAFVHRYDTTSARRWAQARLAALIDAPAIDNPA